MCMMKGVGGGRENKVEEGEVAFCGGRDGEIQDDRSVEEGERDKKW